VGPVALSISVARQQAARMAAWDASVALDRRQGYRGPVARIARGEERRFDDLAQGQVHVGASPVRVAAVTPDSVMVSGAGGSQRLPPSAWQWAAAWSGDAVQNGRQLSDPRDAFAVGDVVLLGDDGRLLQPPGIQAAVLVAGRADGSVIASVGGIDPGTSAFDRAAKGCRQPGSTFKPLVAFAALERGATPASMLQDSPVRVELGAEEAWVPRNADRSFRGVITLWESVVSSRNLPFVELIRRVGPALVVERARRFGVSSPLDPVDALALGGSCLSPLELLTVYGRLAMGGLAWLPDRAPQSSSWLSASSPQRSARQRWAALASVPPSAVPVADPVTVRQVGLLLRDVVRHGTARGASTLGFDVAGKTGTSSRFDTWFAGFTSREVGVAWIGSERNDRALGQRESGAEVALPVWVASIAAPDPTDPLFGDPPPGIELVRIDPVTGLLDEAGREMGFRSGTAPVDRVRGAGGRDAERIERIEREF
jgi:penicillin-binding protein 1A